MLPPSGLSLPAFLSRNLTFFYSLSWSLSYSPSATLIWALSSSEGHSVNPNINNEWRVGAPLWPPECVSLRIHFWCEPEVSLCVCVREETIPDWCEVMTGSSAFPSSNILSFSVLWLSTLSLKLCKRHGSLLGCEWKMRMTLISTWRPLRLVSLLNQWSATGGLRAKNGLSPIISGPSAEFENVI